MDLICYGSRRQTVRDWAIIMQYNRINYDKCKESKYYCSSEPLTYLRPIHDDLRLISFTGATYPSGTHLYVEWSPDVLDRSVFPHILIHSVSIVSDQKTSQISQIYREHLKNVFMLRRIWPLIHLPTLCWPWPTTGRGLMVIFEPGVQTPQ
jgi:hypothetical protein